VTNLSQREDGEFFRRALTSIFLSAFLFKMNFFNEENVKEDDFFEKNSIVDVSAILCRFEELIFTAFFIG